jgi:hypothetical protein
LTGSTGKEFFQLENLDSILEFVAANPKLVSIIDELPSRVKNYFPEARLYMQFSPAFNEEDTSQLLVYLITSQEYDQARINFKALDEQWWLDTFIEAEGNINISLLFE